ncbi:hypothetical protein [Alicyclobacillus acidocaldarius]|uniref:RNA polymerase, sigma 28 subunit, FliA/WhiG subfamily n=1 Tax=Alicyclobacillus acidocaldarius (strain Tc-4-1) TaxID=1048834 RepID=F8IFW7_ALIAT|nr:hypothetical protein [Alicyclobacillus acidocaldarius]AEJ42938.1 hypothetical protein TC41_0985 [Alicyclobacillus acidocaldarius subsp. acidocaldarius Tc-4-1]
MFKHSLLSGSADDFVLASSFASQSFPQPLSKEDEAKYFELWRKYRDKQAHDILVEHNLRLVAHVANVSSTPRPESSRIITHPGD